MKFSHMLFVLTLLLSYQSVQAAEQLKYRLLLQVSEDSVARMNQTLNLSRSVKKEFGPENIDVEIVVFGPGIHTLKYYAPLPIADKVKEVITEGVRIVVSERAMRKNDLKPSDMLQGLHFVQSCIAELVEKQAQGWAYIRP